MVKMYFKDSGEIWELDVDVFHDRAGHYFRSAVHEMKWFRRWFHENCSSVSICDIYVDDKHVGFILVGDRTVVWAKKKTSYSNTCCVKVKEV